MPLHFDRTLSSYMALQQAPARAAVYGTIDPPANQELPEVLVTVATHDAKTRATVRLYETRATVNMTGGLLR